MDAINRQQLPSLVNASRESGDVKVLQDWLEERGIDRNRWVDYWMVSHREVAECFLILLAEYAVTSAEVLPDVVKWADGLIERDEAPEYWMIELAMARTPREAYDQLSHVPGQSLELVARKMTVTWIVRGFGSVEPYFDYNDRLDAEDEALYRAISHFSFSSDYSDEEYVIAAQAEYETLAQQYRERYESLLPS